MSVNGYLTRLAAEGIMRDVEKLKVTNSLAILQERLDAYFVGDVRAGTILKDHFPFGSFTRSTTLPRCMDPHSDIDYLILFADSDAKPQTCLDRLRRFVEQYYKTSEITQSHPTIILSMNHIRFELVPAIETFLSGIQIPAKSSSYSEWMTTSPNELNNKLTQKNKDNKHLIKPLIRLIKYWNACNRYPFESFELEKMVVQRWAFAIALFGGNLWERFEDFMNQLSSFWASTGHQKKSIERAQSIIAEVKKLDSQEYSEEAERKLQRLLPEIGYFVQRA